ncbi:HrpJ domain-containing protein [Veronia pacifica]|uniref:Hypersensitivity response secretion-like HrpJ domain-containing protein n=1 Tax=Veronia pacifica TaxID=1080227 RepID=A0A1C3ER06_9GAMM|nr:HrpJ domain-containing protein [Veronia pacifica]ODA35658.1 hypothetical protein A8L45_03325 [Veronia pacifica]
MLSGMNGLASAKAHDLLYSQQNKPNAGTQQSSNLMQNTFFSFDSLEEVSMKFNEIRLSREKKIDGKELDIREFFKGEGFKKDKQKMSPQDIEFIKKGISLKAKELGNDVCESIFKLSKLMENKIVKGGDLESLLKIAKHDPALCFLALKCGYLDALENNNSRLADKFQHLANELQGRFGKEVQVSLSVSSFYAVLAKDPVKRRQARKMYYDKVLGKGSLQSIMEFIISEFGEEGFVLGCTTTAAALIKNIDEHSHFRSRAELRTLYSDLSRTNTLTDMLKSGNKILSEVKIRVGNVEYNVVDLVKFHIQATKNNVFLNDVNQIVFRLSNGQEKYMSWVACLLQKAIYSMDECQWESPQECFGTRQSIANIVTRITAAIDKDNLGQPRRTTQMLRVR